MTQGDANALLAMPKRFDGPHALTMAPGSDQRHELLAIPHRRNRLPHCASCCEILLSRRLDALLRVWQQIRNRIAGGLASTIPAA